MRSAAVAPFLAALALALAAASCGGGRDTAGTGAVGAPGTAEAPAAPAPAPDAPGPGAGDAAATGPELRAVSTDGLLREVRGSGARATLLNVWATWCQPCRAEFPELLRVERDYRDRGLRLVLVSTDFDPVAPRAFLAERGVDFASFYKEDDDQRFIDGLSPQWSGALPATFVYDADGRLIRFWEGRAEYSAFEQAVLEALAASDPATPEEHP
jgi:thiol-disulfide isomerase/thioredoxin